MGLKGWVFLTEIIAASGAILTILRGELVWALGFGSVLALAALLSRALSLKNPGPFPYSLRWVLLLPRITDSPEHLRKLLEPRSGERVLEIGPGIGMHALRIAPCLLPGGKLDVPDVQKEMLDHLTRRAVKAGITNIVPTQCDARNLPYPDNSFDAAYLIGVLGEIPARRLALRELKRVLRQNGRLVVGEVFFDPDFVSLAVLQEEAGQAGFVFERSLGPRLYYLACFRASPVCADHSGSSAIRAY